MSARRISRCTRERACAQSVSDACTRAVNLVPSPAAHALVG